jgi:hypothetical protein
MPKDRKYYENTLEAQLSEWKADIEVLKARASRAEVGAKENYDKAVEALERKHAEASSQLRRLREARDEAWEEMEIATGKAWEEIKSWFLKPVR